MAPHPSGADHRSSDLHGRLTVGIDDAEGGPRLGDVVARAHVPEHVNVTISTLPRPIGFVLSGGGSLGAIQVGMLRALRDHGVRPDVVVGSSVGALNGAAVALEPDNAAVRLERDWARMRRETVFPGGLLTQARVLQRTRTHLFPNTGLAAVIVDFMGEGRNFADLALPFAAVAMDVATARPHPLVTGPLLPALLASAAIPGLYPEVEIDGRRLYDGGVVANVPLRQAIELGARSLIVLDCTIPGDLSDPPRSLAEILLFTAMVTMRSQARLEAPLIATEVPVVYLPGEAPRMVSPLDFDHTPELIESAYGASHDFLAHLDVTGPGLYGSPSP